MELDIVKAHFSSSILIKSKIILLYKISKESETNLDFKTLQSLGPEKKKFMEMSEASKQTTRHGTFAVLILFSFSILFLLPKITTKDYKFY